MVDFIVPSGVTKVTTVTDSPHGRVFTVADVNPGQKILPAEIIIGDVSPIGGLLAKVDFAPPK